MHRGQLRALVAFPLGLLAAAFAWLAVAHGGALWTAAVHEDGRHTLAATLLYWRHFLREVPVVVLGVAFTAGAFWTYGPPVALPVRRRRAYGYGAALLVVVAAGVAAWQDGRAVAWWDFAQAYTRDDLWQYGSHWRSHWLSSAGTGAAAVAAAAWLGRDRAGTWAAPRAATRRRWIGGGIAAFATATLLWLPNAQPFTDPRFIGHQAREAATHVLITLPLTLAVLLALSAPTAGARVRPMPRDVRVALALGAALALFLGIGALATGAVDVARPAAAPSSLLAAHALEHSLDYLFAVLLAAWLAGRP